MAQHCRDADALVKEDLTRLHRSVENLTEFLITAKNGVSNAQREYNCDLLIVYHRNGAYSCPRFNVALRVTANNQVVFSWPKTVK